MQSQGLIRTPTITWIPTSSRRTNSYHLLFVGQPLGCRQGLRILVLKIFEFKENILGFISLLRSLNKIVSLDFAGFVNVFGNCSARDLSGQFKKKVLYLFEILLSRYLTFEYLRVKGINVRENVEDISHLQKKVE